MRFPLRPALAAPALFLLASPVFAQEGDETVLLGSGKAIETKALDDALQAAAKASQVTGFSVAIVNDNQVVYERAFGTADRKTDAAVETDTLFEFASMSKPAFAALVVDLADEGVIDLDTPLAEYYPHPDLPDDPRAAKFTARHVLTHQTGLPNWRSDREDGKLTVAFEPGTDRLYTGEGFEYLADVLMHVLKTDDRGLDALFQERIAQPAGASDTFYVQNQARVDRKAKGYDKGEDYNGKIDYTDDGFGAAYSIHSTPGDYARLMIGLMAGPSLTDKERGVLFAPQKVTIAEDDPERAIGLIDVALSAPIYDLSIGRFYAHGGNNDGFSGMSAMVPEKGWAFVLVSNENQAQGFIFETTNVIMDLGLDPSILE